MRRVGSLVVIIPVAALAIDLCAMGKKSKPDKKAPRKQTPPAAATGRGGPTRILLLRHGQSEAQATKMDVPDAPLTELGRVQASAWRGSIGRFGADCVLISPLRRALETATLAYEGLDTRLLVCRHARELWWEDKQNEFSHIEDLEPVRVTTFLTASRIISDYRND